MTGLLITPKLCHGCAYCDKYGPSVTKGSVKQKIFYLFILGSKINQILIGNFLTTI